MDLNYFAFFLISFVPMILGLFWYHPKSGIRKWSGESFIHPSKLSLPQIIFCFVLSFALVYGYINTVIHQLGFYELFFTDIMLGSDEAKNIVSEFLGKYGDKHRHFGHGVLHGVINALIFALPFLGITAILDQKSKRYLIYHFSFWLITSAIVGGLIAEFV